jgi:hypothetical protein
VAHGLLCAGAAREASTIKRRHSTRPARFPNAAESSHSQLASDTQIFEVPLALFERRHFYSSELLSSS